MSLASPGDIRIISAKKGGLRRRIVPISPHLLPKLRQWHEEDGLPAGGPIIHWRGKPIKCFRMAWKRAVARAGITRRLRPYDMRHFFATQALAAGADPGTVANIMGSDVATIQKHYQHVLERAKRDVVRLVGNFENTAPEVLSGQ